MKPITTIIFDLSEVYLKGFYLVEEKLAPRLKIGASEIHKRLREKKLEDNFDLLMKGKITEEEYWKQVINFYKWNLSIKDLKKVIRNNFEEIEGTRPIIEKLKKQGYKLGLLSNHSKEWIDYCEKKFNYHKLFHSVLYSFEIEICKPDRKAYELILSKLNAKSEECLFIDDTLKNLKRAEELGIKTILFKDSNQLIRELNKLGIKI